MTASAVGYRPQTRWCGQPPFARVALPARAQQRTGIGRRPALRGAASSEEALLAQLQRDLQRGHWRIALRHFLMLEACGFEVPEAERLHCLEHARACASAQWLRIQADVAEWARCVPS